MVSSIFQLGGISMNKPFAEAKEGSGFESILYEQEQQGVQVGIEAYASILRQCSKGRALSTGKRVHEHIIRTGHAGDRYLGNLLLDMYGKCGDVVEARAVFDRICPKNAYSWTFMIAAYAQNGHSREAIQIFRVMQVEGMKPHGMTLVHVLDACSLLGDLAVCKDCLDARSSISMDVIVSTALVNTYGKCRSLVDARAIFDQMPERNAITWTCMLAGYAQNGHGKEALLLYRRMDLEGVKPTEVTFVSVLDACSSLEDLAEGKAVHARTIGDGVEMGVVLETALLSMYGKCGSLDDAIHLFEGMACKNLVSWNAMISLCVQHKLGQKVIQLFQNMQLEGVKPNTITLVAILGVCSALGSGTEGIQVHGLATECGFEYAVGVGNALIKMYGISGRLDLARTSFENILRKNETSWNTMIGAYAQNGHMKDALKLYQEMQLQGQKGGKIRLLETEDGPWRICRDETSAGGREEDCLLKQLGEAVLVLDQRGIQIDSSTYSYLLSLCCSTKALSQGKRIHAHILENGLEQDTFLGNALVSMYGSCESVHDAEAAFDRVCHKNVFSWTIMIAAYVQNGHNREALQLLWRMELEGAKPNAITFVEVLAACTNLGALAEGRMIHEHIGSIGSNDAVVGTALIHMYGNCGSLQDAISIFNRLNRKDVVSYTSMITAFSQHGHGKQALELFRKMDLEGIKPNEITFINVIDACTSMVALAQGRAAHARITACGIESDKVNNSLVNMYAKCGSLAEARIVFDGMSCRDVICWSIMISGYGQLGHGMEALEMYQRMHLDGITPNEVTLLNILFACSHGGLRDEGWHHFFSMTIDHGITPTTKHYECMVDLLGRAGWLNEAEELMKSISYDQAGWLALLGACRTFGDMECGARAAQRAVELNQEDAAPYALLSNIYAC